MNYQISIIIKALNEEANIATAIESALNALKGISGEVILADSLSSDRTIEIARNYPIKIVQLINPEDRSCGVGPQLGFQVARGEFIYILDGDMALAPDFLSNALKEFESESRLAGVAGMVELIGGESYEFRTRKAKLNHLKESGEQPWLVEGGLYRASALNEVGYFSNRYFHANEEKDLGLRLQAAGWRMLRINKPGVKHYVHTEDSSSMLKRRWRSRYVDGPGELLRASLGKPYIKQVIKGAWKSILVILSWLWLTASLLLIPLTSTPLIATLIAIASYLTVTSIKKRSLFDAWYSFLTNQVYAAGLLRGFHRRPRDPFKHIDYKIITK